MPFKRAVQIGRICLVNSGPGSGKLVVIVDIVDTNRILVDAPGPAIDRHVINMKHLSLTPITIDLPRGARQKKLTSVWEAAKVDSQWEETAWAKKLAARAKRADMNDFDRFRTMVLRKKKRSVVRQEIAAVKKE